MILPQDDECLFPWVDIARNHCWHVSALQKHNMKVYWHKAGCFDKVMYIWWNNDTQIPFGVDASSIVHSANNHAGMGLWSCWYSSTIPPQFISQSDIMIIAPHVFCFITPYAAFSVTVTPLSSSRQLPRISWLTRIRRSAWYAVLVCCVKLSLITTRVVSKTYSKKYAHV